MFNSKEKQHIVELQKELHDKQKEIEKTNNMIKQEQAFRRQLAEIVGAPLAHEYYDFLIQLTKDLREEKLKIDTIARKYPLNELINQYLNVLREDDYISEKEYKNYLEETLIYIRDNFEPYFSEIYHEEIKSATTKLNDIEQQTNSNIHINLHEGYIQKLDAITAYLGTDRNNFLRRIVEEAIMNFRG